MQKRHGTEKIMAKLCQADVELLIEKLIPGGPASGPRGGVSNPVVAPEPAGFDLMILGQQTHKSYTDRDRFFIASLGGEAEPLLLTGHERTEYDLLAVAVQRNQQNLEISRSGAIDEVLRDSQQEDEFLLDQLIADLYRWQCPIQPDCVSRC